MKTVLCKAAEIPAGTVKRVDIAGRPPIAVYNVDGEFFATDDRCTHGDASLSEGVVDEDIIECPLHGGAFEIRTGQPASLPCVLPLRTYRVKVEGENLVAEVETS